MFLKVRYILSWDFHSNTELRNVSVWEIDLDGLKTALKNRVWKKWCCETSKARWCKNRQFWLCWLQHLLWNPELPSKRWPLCSYHPGEASPKCSGWRLLLSSAFQLSLPRCKTWKLSRQAQLLFGHQRITYIDTHATEESPSWALPKSQTHKIVRIKWLFRGTSTDFISFRK